MRRMARIILAAALPACLALPAMGQSVNSIVESLTPKPLTRSWSRGITVEGGEEEPKPPSVDLYVTFAFDSDALDTDAYFVLDNLGRALSDERLREYRFLIAGHTDARGTDEYNMDLSRRRAATVVRYLTQRHGVRLERLESVGYGESQLLDPTRPEDGVNRRVQVVNLSPPTTAQGR